MRFFLLDRVTELVPGERATGVKCVSLSDEVLHDHFPEHPLLPGVFGVEALAQLGGFLLEMSEPAARLPTCRALLVQIQDARFHRPVGPGDRLVLRVAIESRLGESARVRGDATLDGDQAVTARLTFAMREVPSEALWRQRRALYQVWTRGMDPPPELP